jgi:uncharacterized protein
MGTLINVVAIVIATFLGLIFKKGIPDRIQKAIMFALGLGLVAVSIGWFLRDFLVIDGTSIKTEGDLLVLLSLVIGMVIGEKIDIDARLNDWAQGIETKYKLPPLAKGFVAGTLIFCVGSMAILGALMDGISGDPTILIVKSTLDFVTAMVLASVFGIGVAFSALSVLVYQGSITLLAMISADLFTAEITRSLSMVGSLLLIAMGISFMEIKRIKVANMLPALLVPIVYYGFLYVISLFGG